MSIQAREEDRLLPWQQTWNGMTWCDMPGQDFMDKSMNFALFRRGKLDVEMDGETRKLRCVTATFTGRIYSAEEREAKREREMAGKRRRDEQHEHARRHAVARLEVMALRDAQVGSMRMLSEMSGMHPSTISKFVQGTKGLGPENLAMLMESVRELQVAPERAKKQPRARNAVAVPSGFVHFKSWLGAMAERLGLKPHSVYVQCKRGVIPLPEILKVNGRAWFVSAKEVAA